QSPNAAWVSDFGLLLVSNSIADIWFQGLDLITKSDWGVFEKAFLDRWPAIPRATKSAAELQEEMINTRLMTAELGTMVTEGGKEVYCHVKWASQIWELARQAKIVDTNTNIWLIRRELPDALQDLVGEEHKDWHEFCKAITEVKVDMLCDKLRTQRRHDE
ncbi:hypothetical protein DENSPDRAFT_756614, partial [Dentipellis sp. KUC8613]